MSRDDRDDFLERKAMATPTSSNRPSLEVNRSAPASPTPQNANAPEFEGNWREGASQSDVQDDEVIDMPSSTHANVDVGDDDNHPRSRLAIDTRNIRRIQGADPEDTMQQQVQAANDALKVHKLNEADKAAKQAEGDAAAQAQIDAQNVAAAHHGPNAARVRLATRFVNYMVATLGSAGISGGIGALVGSSGGSLGIGLAAGASVGVGCAIVGSALYELGVRGYLHVPG
jgi:hypothetical protein